MIDIQLTKENLAMNSKGKLRELVRYIFVNNSACRELLGGLRKEYELKISELNSYDNRQDINVKMLMEAKAHCSTLHDLSRKLQFTIKDEMSPEEKQGVLETLSVLVYKNIELETAQGRIVQKSMLEKARSHSSWFAKIFGTLALWGAMSTAKVEAKENVSNTSSSVESVTTSKLDTRASVIDGYIMAGLTQVGKPYRFGSNGPNSWDCSAFVGYSFNKVGIKLPRTAREISRLGTSVCKHDMDMSQLKYGDLLFFTLGGRNYGHVGIYVGDGKMLHAGSSTGVAVVKLGSYWQKAFVEAKRLI